VAKKKEPGDKNQETRLKKVGRRETGDWRKKNKTYVNSWLKKRNQGTRVRKQD
jgi:hypothetical protein